MDEYRVINIDAASEITGGDKQLFCDILDLFIEIAPVQLRRIKTASDEKNYEELAAGAHDIKSSASSFAGEELYHSAFVLEENAKNKFDLNLIYSMIRDIDENIQSAIRLYKKLDWESDFKEEI